MTYDDEGAHPVRLTWRRGLRLLRPADWLVLIAAVGLVGLSVVWFWQQGGPDRLIIRTDGEVYKELMLPLQQKVTVPGPLGQTVIQIRQYQARVLSDPSPRQYCVQQGWLRRNGAVAVCLPNRVSIELSSGAQPYDSLTY